MARMGTNATIASLSLARAAGKQFLLFVRDDVSWSVREPGMD